MSQNEASRDRRAPTATVQQDNRKPRNPLPGCSSHLPLFLYFLSKNLLFLEPMKISRPGSSTPKKNTMLTILFFNKPPISKFFNPSLVRSGQQTERLHCSSHGKIFKTFRLYLKTLLLVFHYFHYMDNTVFIVRNEIVFKLKYSTCCVMSCLSRLT